MADPERELRLKIAAQILCVRMEQLRYDGSMPHASWLAGISAECIRWADALIEVHDHMHAEDK